MLRLAVVLCLTWATLISAAQFYGQVVALSGDPRVGTIDIGGCLKSPCVLGLTPGQTPWGQAQAKLAGYTLIESDDKRIIFRAAPDIVTEVYLSVDGKHVGRVYVDFHPEKPLPMGWVVKLYGPPCGVSFYPNSRILTLRYRFLLANVRLVGTARGLYAPVMNLRFADPAFRLRSQPNLCIDNITGQGVANRHWEGFAAFERYGRWGR
jgi:hypothetical protein